MALHSVYIEHDDEKLGERALRLSYFEGGTNSLGQPISPVVFFAIGNLDESTYEDSFKYDDASQFSITREDLMRALIGLGIIDTTTGLNPNPEPTHAA